jgi:hypothetical protein
MGRRALVLNVHGQACACAECAWAGVRLCRIPNDPRAE